MSDLIREVDEELRREDWQKVWKTYGKFVIGGAVAVVLATAAVVAWREYDQSRRMAAGDRFAAAVARVENAASPEQAADAMAGLAADAPGGYAVLARFREAKFLVDAGDRNAAIAAYDALAADGAVEPMFRDLATLYAVRLQMADGDPASLAQRLAPLTDASNPWRFTARELTAVLALSTGNAEEARRLYAELADDQGTPESLRARAAEMLRALGTAE